MPAGRGVSGALICQRDACAGNDGEELPVLKSPETEAGHPDMGALLCGIFLPVSAQILHGGHKTEGPCDRGLVLADCKTVVSGIDSIRSLKWRKDLTVRIVDQSRFFHLSACVKNPRRGDSDLIPHAVGKQHADRLRGNVPGLLQHQDIFSARFTDGTGKFHPVRETDGL